MKQASFYTPGPEDKTSCHLCAHHCVISPGKRGICGVRENRNGVLYSLVYGKVVARHVDPIEKKPLYHFYPGSRSCSIATVGCNLRCRHCQNYDISEYARLHPDIPGVAMTPDEVVGEALKAGCQSISYTYTEPTIFMEFALDCAMAARERGVKNVFVSNGYMTPESVKAIAPYLDADNIDLKGDDEFYKKITGSRLQPVLDTIRLMKELGVWVEVTTLIIPGLNDSDEFLRFAAGFIASVDAAMPWHVTQFYPTHELLDRPRTPVSTLVKARDIGLQAGLKHIYVGNVPAGDMEHTHCGSCGELLIRRMGFYLESMKTEGGKCPRCKRQLEGRGIP